jgi:hypothetical protein
MPQWHFNGLDGGKRKVQDDIIQRKAKEKAAKEKQKKDNTPKKVKKKKSVRGKAIAAVGNPKYGHFALLSTVSREEKKKKKEIAAAAHDKEMRDMGGVPYGRKGRYIRETAAQKRVREILIWICQRNEPGAS